MNYIWPVNPCVNFPGIQEVGFREKMPDLDPVSDSYGSGKDGGTSDEETDDLFNWDRL